MQNYNVYQELKENEPSPSNLLPFFLSQKEHIQQSLEEGYSRKKIWKRLKKDGVFLGSYFTFCKYVTNYLPNVSPIQVKPQIQTKKQPLKTTRESATKNNDGFNWTPNYNPEDLI